MRSLPHLENLSALQNGSYGVLSCSWVLVIAFRGQLKSLNAIWCTGLFGNANNLAHVVLGGCGNWQRTWAMKEVGRWSYQKAIRGHSKGSGPMEDSMGHPNNWFASSPSNSCEEFNWKHLNCTDLFCSLFNQVESRALYMVVVRPLDVVQGRGMQKDRLWISALHLSLSHWWNLGAGSLEIECENKWWIKLGFQGNSILNLPPSQVQLRNSSAECPPPLRVPRGLISVWMEWNPLDRRLIESHVGHWTNLLQSDSNYN